jgi:hypothetical protein
MSIEFFSMVSRAAFTNPFSEERLEVDREILGASPGAGWESMLGPLQEAIRVRLDELAATPLGIRISHEPGSEGQAVAITILFYVFHRYIGRFDGLIEEQLAVGDEPVECSFVLDCVHELQGYGFGHQEACRYAAIFYQVRRAFYFISKGLLGESGCMKRLRKRLWDNIFTADISWYERTLWDRMEDFSTLLLGETGAGKGAAAAAIGRSGFIPFYPNKMRFAESFTRAFVSINLSQYPESLIESELFGHRKGAFTGAFEPHEGVFARCSRFGAIFLDEIGEVSIPIQIKLLQVLQERTFSPVGSHEKRRFEGRVIAATNQSVDLLRRAGRFRDDFYYRLCSDIITVPPLRERIRESVRELELLAGHILRKIAGADVSGLEPSVMAVLKRDFAKGYAWPGNVRELEQAIRRILLTGRYEGDFSSGGCETALLERAVGSELTAKELTAHYCKALYEVYGNYREVGKRIEVDWRTVKKYVAGEL